MNKVILISAALSGVVHCGFLLWPGVGTGQAATDTITRIEDVKLAEPEPPAPVCGERVEAEATSPLPDSLVATGLDDPVPETVALDVLTQYTQLSAPHIKRPDSLVVGIPSGAQIGDGEKARKALVFSLEQLDSIPRLRKGVKPHYPRQLLAAHIEGLVRMLVLLDERGRVSVQKVLEADREEFEQSAIEAAEGFVYDPPTKNGKPVNTEFILPIRFAIN
jgi:periplasmic protein TonB